MKLLVVDNGFNTELARRLGESGLFTNVAYFAPWQTDFVATRERAIGTGFDEFDRIYDISESTLEKFDAFFFPDLYWGDLAIHLRDNGYPVWSAFESEQLELDRRFLIETMVGLGMRLPRHTVKKGITAALATAKDGDFLKITGYSRGDFETAKHEAAFPTWPAKLRKRMGPLADDIPIIIEKPIEDDHEVGWDAIVLGGKVTWPMMLGYEKKDSAYLSKVIRQFPGPLATDSLKLLHYIETTPYAQFMSTEFRGNVLIDLTTRTPSPPSDIHLGFWKNFAVAVHGWLDDNIQPRSWQPTAAYAAEAIIKNTSQGDYIWIDVPPEHRAQVGVRHAFVHSGKLWAAPPRDDVMEEVGAVWASGSSPEKAIGNLEIILDDIKMSESCKVDTETLHALLKTVEKGEKEGIPF